MTEGTHTPGPWKASVERHKTVGRLVYRNDGAGNNHVQICRNIHSDADAHLIAAAPALLKAAQLALPFFEQWWPKDFEPAVKLRAAIAAATGQQQGVR